MRVRWLMWCALFALNGSPALAQTTSVRVEVRAEAGPVAGAEVIVNGGSHKTDADGIVVVNVPAGTVEIVVVKAGFAPASASVQVQAGQQQAVAFDLTNEATIHEEVTVSAARTDKRLEDVPMRVEVLSADEIEEKVMMTPGDIVMMLNEMGAMRVQATSPSLGRPSERNRVYRPRIP
jgi:iron complex outermembrane receptor protein